MTVLPPAPEARRSPPEEETYLLRRLVDAAADSNRRSLPIEKELAALRAAVGQHAIQLQSHTAAVRDLARSATDLRDAVADIGLLARNVADADGTLDHSKMAQGPNPAAGVARLAPETEPLPLAGWYHDLTGESTLRYWTANICSRTMSPRRPVVLRGAFRCAAMPSSVCEQDRVACTAR